MAKADIYLLKGTPRTDDYATRRLVASEVTLVGKVDRWSLFRNSTCSLTFDLTVGRFNPEFLIPDKYYRVDLDGAVSYYGLRSYERKNGELTLNLELL